ARRAPARRSRLAPDRARRPATPRHEAAPDRRAARSGLDDGDGALFGRGPVVRAERLLELLLELARHRQLLDDVGASDQLALDEDLRDRRPPVEPGELLADRRIWEDVDRRDRRAGLLERAQGAV